MRHLNIKISGQVQGVAFRYSAKEVADHLNTTGFVKNDPDSTVYIEAEGEEEDLGKFVEWCKTGPKFARVVKVEVSEDKLKNFSNFQIS